MTTMTERFAEDALLASDPDRVEPEPADPDARIPEAPYGRHMLRVSLFDGVRIAHLEDHPEGAYPVEECERIREAFYVWAFGWMPNPAALTDPKAMPVIQAKTIAGRPGDRWWCSVDEGGLFEIGGRCLP